MPNPSRQPGLIQRYGGAEVNPLLTHLAVELQVSASPQNQALTALLFLYRELLERDLRWLACCMGEGFA